MSSHFGLSIRFLDPAFHGRGDGGQPEWPPSPLRVFQALTAAAAARRCLDTSTSALEWLERQQPPNVIAPARLKPDGYCLSVPNNAMDIVAAAWSRGNLSNSGDANPATHRTMKTVRPSRLLDGDAVHFLWPLGDSLSADVRSHIEALCEVARSVVALGWGIDMAVAHGAVASDEQIASMPGERWFPSSGSTESDLRVPIAGTLAALVRRHGRFLTRLEGNVFTPPPPMDAFSTIGYRRSTDQPARPFAAFSLLKLDGSGFCAFDTTRRALTVAGMMRHAAKVAAERAGWPAPQVNSFVLGHGVAAQDDSGEGHVPVGPKRFAYLPLPSIEARGDGKARVIGAVRRLLLTSFADGCDQEVAWARRALPGQELLGTADNHAALLSLLPGTDNVVQCYTRAASSWSTVTPVVLPGHDDPAHYRRRLQRVTSADEQKELLGCIAERVDGLLRKAILHSGHSPELAENAELEWRAGGFRPGVEMATRYGVPDHLRRFPRLHVKLNWRDARGKPVEVTGPVCLGSGRFYGLGLFAAM